MYATIDKPEGLDPKGEFFCRYRERWMPEIDGKLDMLMMKIIMLMDHGRNLS
jgi:hypothetical protein